jgi:hypothetical protein
LRVRFIRDNQADIVGKIVLTRMLFLAFQENSEKENTDANHHPNPRTQLQRMPLHGPHQEKINALPSNDGRERLPHKSLDKR